MRRLIAPYRVLNILLALSFLVAMTGFQTPTNVVGYNPSPGCDQPDSTLRCPAPSPTCELSYDQSAFWVVRAYFSNRQMVDDVVSWLAPWEVNHEQGYLVVDVTSAQINQLEQAGFVVEIDHELTHHLNTPNQPLPGQISGIPGYPCYRTVEETYASAEQIAADYPTLASWIKIGESWEKVFGILPGYDMMLLKLTNNQIDVPKPSLFIMASMHAREYTPAELATRYAELLVENYGIDADITWLLDYHEIHLLLHANPDGRKLAEAGSSWRKNTNSNYCENPNQYGIDLNRNYPYQWGCCGGSSGNPCYDTYRGPFSNSEPETYTVNNYLVEIFPDQRGDDPNDPVPVDATGVFLDLHSYMELVLWPWGWTSASSPNGTALQTLGRKFAYFNDYTPYQSYNLYPTDGTTIDTAYGHLGLAAYTFELGTSFFQSCSYFENYIIPENMPALIYAAKVARTPYMTPAGPDALDLNLSETEVERGEPVTLTAVLDDTRFNNSQGYEPTQNIAAGEVYINIPPWLEDQNPQPLPMQPADGQFNNPIETATITLETNDLESGQHILFVRGQDAAGNWGAFSAVFLDVFASELEHSKTASHNQAFAGEVIDYTVSQTLSYFEGIPATQTITDSLPTELIVVTDSIHLNGEPAPDLYDADTHQIIYEWSGVPESNENTFVITYQAQVDPEIDEIKEIHNTLESEAEVDGETIPVPDPLVVNLTVYPLPLLAHNKTASASQGIPAEIITYTLTQEMSLPAEFEVTHQLTDTLPPELIVLTETIQVNGQPAPDLYDPDQHTIVFNHTATYDGITEVTITYQAQIDPDITETMEIENTLQSMAEIGNYLLQAPEPAVFNLSVLEAPQLTHLKEANLTEVIPGETITFTLTQELVLPKMFSVMNEMIDRLPPELLILVDTIELNGNPAPELYDPVEHTIAFIQTDMLDGTIETIITYQVQVDPQITDPIAINNLLDSQVELNEHVAINIDSYVYNLSVLEAPKLTHIKEADLSQAAPGEAVSYTIAQQLVLPQGFSAVLELVDVLPPELVVLIETIQINGEPAPELYNADTHQITYQWSGGPESHQGTVTITITYQAEINPEAEAGTELENLLASQASVNAVDVSAPGPVKASVYVSPIIWHFYVPISVRN